MSYVSQTTAYCGYTRYARVSHSRQWSNYNLVLHFGWIYCQQNSIIAGSEHRDSSYADAL